MILNLLSNATKYTDAGGTITVGVDTDAGLARLQVADTGMGLSTEMMSRIFDLFSRVHPEQAGGLGIGLSVVQRLVEMHDGGIAVHSKGLGQGSEFTVTLPLIAAPAPAVSTDRAETASSPQNPRVLVIDDNRDAADALTAFLRSHDLAVQVAYTGVDGIAAADALRPDVVLLDIGMPGVDGYQVAQQLRRRPWGPAVKLIAVTGWGQAQDRTRTQGAGFDGHLVKPVDPDLLLAWVRERFSGATASDAPERASV